MAGVEIGPTRLSERSLADSEAALGYATTRELDRQLAACGLLAAAGLEFTAADDVPQAGVLCALPALLTEGLLRHTRTFYALSPGYYPLEAIFLYLALLALVRCRSLEQTRYQSPGEWGRILGLDRLPEVKTLRAKIAELCALVGQAVQWQSRLAKEWIAAAADPADVPSLGLFYESARRRRADGRPVVPGKLSQIHAGKLWSRPGYRARHDASSRDHRDRQPGPAPT